MVRVNNADGEYVRRKAQREAMALGGLESDFAPRLIHYDEAAAFFESVARLPLGGFLVRNVPNDRERVTSPRPVGCVSLAGLGAPRIPLKRSRGTWSR